MGGQDNISRAPDPTGVRRPPLAVILVALVMTALGETSGAVMSQLRAPFDRWARARITANAAAHGLTGAAEYDDEVRGRAVFAAEAGLSFLHTHAEGLGLVVLFGSTITATVVHSRRLRAALHALLAIGGFFPLGYLVYAVAVVERGREPGVELGERWILTPLGTAAILGLVALAIALGAAHKRATRDPVRPAPTGGE